MSGKIPRTVREQLEQVRQSGRANMYFRREVQYAADKMEFYALVCWLEDYPDEYGRGLSEGWEVVEDGEEVAG